MDIRAKANKTHFAITIRIKYRWFVCCTLALTLCAALLGDDCEVQAFTIVAWVTYLNYVIETNLC